MIEATEWNLKKLRYYLGCLLMDQDGDIIRIIGYEVDTKVETVKRGWRKSPILKEISYIKCIKFRSAKEEGMMGGSSWEEDRKDLEKILEEVLPERRNRYLTAKLSMSIFKSDDESMKEQKKKEEIL